MRIIRGHAGSRGRPRWIVSCTWPDCHLVGNAEALCMVRIVTSRAQHLRVDEKANRRGIFEGTESRDLSLLHHVRDPATAWNCLV